MKTKTHRPCSSCPWRKDVKPGLWHRDHFQSIANECRGNGMRVMGCHKADGSICVGWAAVEGFNAIGVRIAALTKQYDPKKLNTKGLEMYASMREMIEANNVVYVAQGQEAVCVRGE